MAPLRSVVDPPACLEGRICVHDALEVAGSLPEGFSGKMRSAVWFVWIESQATLQEAVAYALHHRHRAAGGGGPTSPTACEWNLTGAWDFVVVLRYSTSSGEDTGTNHVLRWRLSIIKR